MNTDDKHDNLAELFRNFDPELHSDHSFMHDIQQRIEGVDMVRKECVKTRHATRSAVVAGIIAGFIAGVIATLAYPHLTSVASGLSDTAIQSSETWTNTAAQILSVAFSIGSALGVYNLALKLIPSKG